MMNRKIFTLTLFLVLFHVPFSKITIAHANPFILISDEQEASIGRSVAKRIEKKFNIVKDTNLNQRIDQIGDKLTKVCGRRTLNYRFTIIEDKEKKEEFNAFALPGGYIYIFKPLLEKCDTDDEVAAILAHEIGHVVARHSMKRLQGSLGFGALGILMILGRRDGIDARSKRIADLAFVSMMLSYSRQDELEADRLSITFLKKSNYDPNAAITVLEKIRDINQKGLLRPHSYFRSHPYISARIMEARKQITGKINFEDYINNP